MYTCKKCLKEKPRDLDNFPPAKGNRDGMSGKCRECTRLYMKVAARSWRERNPDRYKQHQETGKTKNYRLRNLERNPHYYRNRQLKREYGITYTEYDQRVKEQGGLCGVCNQLAKLVVDHCHVGGDIRGLLCTTCNIGLGMFKDNPDVLRLAIKYLESRKNAN